MTGYNYYALTDLFIGLTHAFTPGALVPDSTVAAQGWVTGRDVNPIGTPPPTAQSLIFSGDPTDGDIVVWDATTGTWVPEANTGAGGAFADSVTGQWTLG